MKEEDDTAVELAIERTIEEALMVNPRTESVEDFEFEWEPSVVHVKFTVYAIHWEKFDLEVTLKGDENLAEEFVTPEFIDNSDPDTIQSRMMNNLPVDISDMPADFPHDFTMPTAIEISRLIQYNLTRTLMLMFPM